jgi:hypothetical protein
MQSDGRDAAGPEQIQSVPLQTDVCPAVQVEGTPAAAALHFHCEPVHEGICPASHVEAGTEAGVEQVHAPPLLVSVWPSVQVGSEMELPWGERDEQAATHTSAANRTRGRICRSPRD